MYIISVVSLLSGVAVFMLGMLLIKYALESNFRDKLKVLLGRFTKNRFMSVLTGAFVTFSLQSSSASSVLTASFADSGIISLYTAFWLIVGANVGTTFTGLLTAFPFTQAVPVFCAVGIILISLSKKQGTMCAGILFSGFGLLFVGMRLMGDGADTLTEIPLLRQLLLSCDSPVTGVVTGTVVTAVIQSSSAFTALLQTLAGEGIIGTRHAFFLLLGANIGTCATCAVTSLGLKGGAKRVSLMHILYNLSGAVLFILLSEIFPLDGMLSGLPDASVKTRIAEINILFNVITAVLSLMLPVRDKRKSNKNIQTHKCIC